MTTVYFKGENKGVHMLDMKTVKALVPCRDTDEIAVFTKDGCTMLLDATLISNSHRFKLTPIKTKEK